MVKGLGDYPNFSSHRGHRRLGDHPALARALIWVYGSIYTEPPAAPFFVEAKRGHDVTFVNVDNETMRLMPVDVADKSGYAGLGQSKSVGRGGTWTTNFTKPGTWGYYN